MGSIVVVVWASAPPALINALIKALFNGDVNWGSIVVVVWASATPALINASVDVCVDAWTNATDRPCH